MDFTDPNFIEFVNGLIEKLLAVPVLAFVIAVLYKDHKDKMKLISIIDKALNGKKKEQ